MQRRDFLKTASCVCGAIGAASFPAGGSSTPLTNAGNAQPDPGSQLNLADTALRLAKVRGARYADFRIGTTMTESLHTREDKLLSAQLQIASGFGVRVLHNGSWGFAGSSIVNEDAVARAVAHAFENAEAMSLVQQTAIAIEDIPAYVADWTMPLKIDPFSISIEEKAAKLLAINASGAKAGADFCRSNLYFVREQRLFASSRGSRITQSRVRAMPSFEVTAIDKATGRFATRDSLAAPRGSGWEYILSHDFDKEAATAATEAREKLSAKPVEPGNYDLVIDPTNLWLTIHESIGHSTELDRALGWEANFAGTSFVTPDKLGNLRFGTDLMTVMADRSQEGGLATVGYDDDGVKTEGAEFPIIERGVFQNYQMALGQAQLIGRDRSNGCAYCDNPAAFPIQRMPNISLQPHPSPSSLDDLFAAVENGIYIVGAGSWSIDQQRFNFQFGGQLFYEIKNGKRGAMLRDVAYQSDTTRFWNSMDAIGDRSTYVLGGSFFCGKGEPMQLAPVSHGAPCARFRGVSVLNTERKDI